MRVWLTNFFAREVPCTLEISVTLEGGEHPPQLVDFLRKRADRLWTNPDGSMLALFIREFRLESLQQRLPRFLRALELRLLRLGARRGTLDWRPAFAYNWSFEGWGCSKERALEELLRRQRN